MPEVPQFITSVVAWLRAGYPEGVPQQDYQPLFALLGSQLTLTNENGTQTVGQMLSPTSFQAWGQTAQVVQDGNLT